MAIISRVEQSDPDIPQTKVHPNHSLLKIWSNHPPSSTVSAPENPPVLPVQQLPSKATVARRRPIRKQALLPPYGRQGQARLKSGEADIYHVYTPPKSIFEIVSDNQPSGLSRNSRLVQRTCRHGIATANQSR